MIATREGYICLLRKNWLEGKCLIQLTSEVVDMVLMPGDNFIVVATSDNNLQCFNKKVCSINLVLVKALLYYCLGSKIVDMQNVKPDHLPLFGSVKPLKHLFSSCRFKKWLNPVVSRQIRCRFYLRGRHTFCNWVWTIRPGGECDDNYYYRYRQSIFYNVLIVWKSVHLGGSINFKILKRTADFSLKPLESSQVLQSKPLPLPKRSKLFLEQSIRERQTALGMNLMYIHR